jgi:hypothetical protein
MTQADSVLGTPPTNTPISQSKPMDGSRDASSLLPPSQALLVLAVCHRRDGFAGSISGGFFVRAQMNYQAFTNDSLTMMYEAIRGALAADDALKRQGLAIRFRVRETPDWKIHAADLESEMLKRGMRFEVIDWSDDQPPH